MPDSDAMDGKREPRDHRDVGAARVSGDCWIHLAFDAAAAIDLEAAERDLPRRLSPASPNVERETLSKARRTPSTMQFRPRPLRMLAPAEPLSLGSAGSAWRTVAEVELTLYDFGAVSVAYRVPFTDSTLDDLRSLSAIVHDAPALLEAARAQVARLVGLLGPIARRAAVAEPVEDYVVFHVERWNGGSPEGTAFDLARDAGALAAVLRSAEEPLSAEEIADALACVVSYGLRDRVVIDWSSAIIVEPERSSAADLLAVLEFANVELVELRFLDDRLDAILDRAYRALWHPVGSIGSEGERPWHRRFADWGGEARRERRRLAALHMDSALLFEGVNNAIKLLGDQYLARVYRLVAKRFHLGEWDAAILRKIETLQRLYEKTADEHATRRMEVLEWVIIILIALSIVLAFVPGGK